MSLCCDGLWCNISVYQVIKNWQPPTWWFHTPLYVYRGNTKLIFEQTMRRLDDMCWFAVHWNHTHSRKCDPKIHSLTSVGCSVQFVLAGLYLIPVEIFLCSEVFYYIVFHNFHILEAQVTIIICKSAKRNRRETA